MTKDEHRINNDPTLPTPDQLKNSALMGWEYTGNGVFVKGERMGWFENGSFNSEPMD